VILWIFFFFFFSSIRFRFCHLFRLRRLLYLLLRALRCPMANAIKKSELRAAIGDHTFGVFFSLEAVLWEGRGLMVCISFLCTLSFYKSCRPCGYIYILYLLGSSIHVQLIGRITR
jgi:SMC interacting uncharacterized protein involved in chromosome segregation